MMPAPTSRTTPSTRAETLYTFWVDGRVHLLHAQWSGIMDLIARWGPGHYEIAPYDGSNPTRRRADATVLRLAEHLASEAFPFGTEDCALTGFSGSGRCIEPAVAMRWKNNLADAVCEEHAARAAGRGEWIVWPQRHDGLSATLSTPPAQPSATSLTKETNHA